MFYADSEGLANIVRSMHGFAKGYRPEAWEPAPLLKRLAAENRDFASWGKSS
jgi:3-hydroxyacyl-CoA dehydrogenase